MDIRLVLLLLCFFVSGFAGLVYETAWTRELAFVFGTSELAVSAVLAAYMAGLALGAGLAARFAPRLRRPVLAYGVLELGIGLAALAVPFGIRLVSGVYLHWLGGLDAPPEAVGLGVALFHLLATFVVLVPCTALMGATLPLLARHAVRTDEQIGPRIGLLYATNTAGAIAGTLVTAFLLLPELGLRHTVYVGVAANLLVFGAAAGLARRISPATTPRGGAGLAATWILPAIAISGAVSFVYEVVWVRLLGFVLGGSTAAFSTMLASFLLGIALGSAVAARFARTRRAAALGFVVAQLGTGALSWAIFRLADRLPDIARFLQASPSDLTAGSIASIGLMLPITLCIGATFPFAVKLHSSRADDAARASARVYAWNTVGSIVGSVAAGFFLLPALGFEGTVLLGVLVNVALAVWATLAQPAARRSALAACALVGIGVVVLPPAVPDRLFLYSGLGARRLSGTLEFAAVGRSATVALIRSEHAWRLQTNGLPESTIEEAINPPDRFHPARWLALLPVLCRPDARDMLLIGLGGGNTAGAITPGLESIDVIELEPEVVEANRRVADQRMYGDPLADPRVSLHYGDARGALVLTDRLYDAIVSQPSHPWTSGASHLYTREFFALAASRLTPDGVFVQWIGRSFVDEPLLRGLLATLGDVFPYVELFQPVDQALLFVASREPLEMIEHSRRAIAAAPEIFGRVGIHRVEDVAAVQSLDVDGTRALARGAVRITDDHNLLATSAWQIGDPKAAAAAIDRAIAAEDPLPGRLDRLDPALLVRSLVSRGRAERVVGLLRSLEEVDRQVAAGWLAYELGQEQRSSRLFERALAAEPGRRDARMGALLCDPARVDRSVLAPDDAAIAEAVVGFREGDLEGVRALDAALARVGPGDLLYEEVARARIAWRLQLGDAADAAEALRLTDVLIARSPSPVDYLSRAAAAYRAGRPDVAWATLSRLRPRLVRQGPDSPLLVHARSIAASLPPSPEDEAVRRFLLGAPARP